MALPSLRVTEVRRRENQANLRAAWGFAEGSGVVARDSTGSGNNLTVDASVTWPAGHSGGTAIGNSGSGSAHAVWTLSGNEITMMGWARPLDLTSGTNVALFGVWSTPDTTGSTHVAIWAQRGDFGSSNVLQGNVRIDSNLSPISGPALTLNAWAHLALSYDGTTIRLYRNGVEVATSTNAGTLASGSNFFCAVPSPTNSQVDDIRIYSTALSTAQIVEAMNNPVAAP